MKTNTKLKIPERKSRRVFDSIIQSNENECDSLLETEEILFFMKLELSTKKRVKKTER